MKNKIFDNNPSLDCYFETSDGECFFTDNSAKNHARSLTDKTIKRHYKSEATQEVTEPVTDTDVQATVDSSQEVVPPVQETTNTTQEVVTENVANINVVDEKNVSKEVTKNSKK